MTEKKTSKPAMAKRTARNTLPQNLLQVGEHSVTDKKIYILQSVYKEIQKFAKRSAKTKVEAGGVLLGTVKFSESKKADGVTLPKPHILIEGFIEAKFSEATSQTLTFTHKTWEHIYKEQEKRFPKKKIIGWIHTHPDYDIFLSDHDKFIQQTVFNDENQVAYVIDPIKKTEGFFSWKGEEIVDVKGFYIYDQVDTKLTVTPLQPAVDADEAQPQSTSTFTNILLGVLSVAVIFLLILTMTMNSRMNKAEDKLAALELTLAQQNIYYSQQLSELEGRVAALEPSEQAQPSDDATNEQPDEATDATDGGNENE